MKGLLMQAWDAALDPYRNWTEPRDGVGSNPIRLASKLEPPAPVDDVPAAWPLHTLLPELKMLWLLSREGWLFWDIDYGQWGLHILAPAAAGARTSVERSERPGDFEATDVVIGDTRRRLVPRWCHGLPNDLPSGAHDLICSGFQKLQ